MAPGTTDTLARLLESAAPWATPHALGLWLLRGDPQYLRIELARRDTLVDAALDDGRRTADDARARWGDDPNAIAAACRLSIVDCDDEQGWGTAVVYADYNQRMRCIHLFRPSIARLDRGLRRDAVSRITGAVEARPMLLAHELYHHLDAVRVGAPIARRHRVTLFGLGRWCWTSGLISLSEIAAGAFAQRLLRLHWHPRFFDLISVHDASPAAAARLAAGLRSGDQVINHERGFAT